MRATLSSLWNASRHVTHGRMLGRNKHRGGMSQSDELYRAFFPDGTHLASSTRTAGAFLGAILDDETNILRGQAEFIEVDHTDDSDDEGESAPSIPPLLAIALGIAAGVLGTMVVVKRGPSIKSWWLEAALPRLRSRWDKLIRPGDEEVVSPDSALTIQTSDFSREIALVLEDKRATISSTEVQRRFLALLLAAALVAEQVRLLEDVQIGDDAQVRELRSAIEILTTSQSAAITNQILEANEAPLDYTTRKVFIKIFGGGAKVDGHYAPVQRTRIAAALHIPDIGTPQL